MMCADAESKAARSKRGMASKPSEARLPRSSLSTRPRIAARTIPLCSGLSEETAFSSKGRTAATAERMAPRAEWASPERPTGGPFCGDSHSESRARAASVDSGTASTSSRLIANSVNSTGGEASFIFSDQSESAPVTARGSLSRLSTAGSVIRVSQRSARTAKSSRESLSPGRVRRKASSADGWERTG